jgi:putative nucleotidyltransferase with HDIG domain
VGSLLPHDIRTLADLAALADALDTGRAGHSLRVQRYATELAAALELPAVEIRSIHAAALLHDIGKLAVPTHILSKPGPLTALEMDAIRIHPHVGAELTCRVPFPYPVATLILAHHERWDGSGYPHGIPGDRIPLGARVIAASDCFDALTSDRPYQSAMSVEAALDVLEDERGKTLDPLVVEAFIDLLPDLLDPRAIGVDARPDIFYRYDWLST